MENRFLLLRRDRLRASRNAQMVSSLTTLGFIKILPQSYYGRDQAMSEFDWRSPEAYQRAVKSGEMEDFAWESLRRSPNYRSACQQARSKGGVATSEFRRRWGLCFRS